MRSIRIRMVTDSLVVKDVLLVFLLRKERPFSWVDCLLRESLFPHNW